MSLLDKDIEKLKDEVITKGDISAGAAIILLKNIGAKYEDLPSDQRVVIAKLTKWLMGFGFK
ncbi:hypothetical protein [Desulfosporosinus nitroreducens]|uniref:hypothetical protein n=1 Tax=Desulfosporosinus nitroreducens TaxID=2018668 RepID=UPI00207CF471|nr:hypothetical protein [Desulfosporosinus nitroreducens]MCO1601006.1 hypothetical protein [Desulfosporosinus nitroreducens]